MRGKCTSAPAGFGLLLRRHRTAAGLTQVRLAERTGYYVNYLRKLERGERRPSRDVTAALADALSMSTADRVLFERVATSGALSQHVLVGREREMAILESRLDGGKPGLLLLSGEPGIGKTRLLAEARRLADERGMLTLTASCLTESTIPFGPFREALERPLWAKRPDERIRCLAGCERLAYLIAESIGVTFQLRPVLSIEEEQQLIFEAVVRFLERLADGRDIVLLLDDMHGVDEDTLDLLGQLLWLSGLPLHVIGACRASRGLNDAVGELVRAGMAETVMLQPLTASQAETLLDDMLGGAVGPEHTERLITRTGGIPGFLAGLARAPLDGPVPEEMADEILTRVRTLPQAGQKALSVIAGAGGSTSLHLVAEVSRSTEEDLVEVLATACLEGLLDLEEHGSYIFRCGIIREVVAGSLTPARQAAIRQRIAEATRRLKAGDQSSGPLGASAAGVPQPDGVTLAPVTGWCTGA